MMASIVDGKDEGKYGKRDRLSAFFTRHFRSPSRERGDATPRRSQEEENPSLEDHRVQSKIPTTLEKTGAAQVWDEAWASIQSEKPKLVAQYQKYLLSQCDSTVQDETGLDQLSGKEKKEKLIEAAKSKVATTQAKLADGSLESKVKSVAEGIVATLIQWKDLVTALASQEPHAALAWTGCCVILPLLLNPTSEKTAALDGFADVARILCRYNVLEADMYGGSRITDLSGSDIVQLQDQLRKYLVKLYAMIVDFQIRLVLRYDRTVLLRFLRDTVKTDDWQSLVKNIQELEKSNLRDIQAIGHHVMIHVQSTVERQGEQIAMGFSEMAKSINVIQDNIESLRRENYDRQGRTETVNILDVFSKDTGYDRQKDRNNVCAPDTGNWFFHHPEYEAFKSSTGSQLLFVTAEAGGGKSTTMRTLVDDMKESNQAPFLAYFFFKDEGDDKENFCSYDTALSTMIYQLLVQEHGFIQYAEKAYRQYGATIRHNTKQMWNILDMIASQAGRTVLCVLDALDECAHSDRKRLVADFATYFHNKTSPSSQLRLIATARPYQDGNHTYEDLFTANNVRHLPGEEAEVQSDIFEVIRLKAQELSRKRQLDKTVEEILVHRLLQENDRTRSFLAVEMAFELLDSDGRMLRGASALTISKILTDIPQRLGDRFDKMLERSQDSDHAWRLFCIILGARRTITIPEFKVIYSLTEPANDKVGRAYSYEELEMPTNNEDFKQLSAREHLMAKQEVMAQEMPSAYHARLRDDHLFYLGEEFREFIIEDRLLCQYAALNWHEHIVLGGHDAPKILRDPRYAAVLDLSHTAFWIWFLSILRYGRRKDINDPISNIWAVMDVPYSYPTTGEESSFLREIVMKKLCPMHKNVQALFQDAVVTSDTTLSLAGGPQWRADRGYDLIDAFHLSYEGYHLLSATQIVQAMDQGDEPREAILRANATPSIQMLIWTCIVYGATHALQTILASVTDLAWLNDIPEHTLRSVYGVSRLEFEWLAGTPRPWPPTFLIISRASLIPTINKISDILADWITSSPRPRQYAQQMWEAGWFIVAPLCRRLVHNGASIDCRMWQDGRTALQIAAACRAHDTIDALLQLGADPTTCSTNGFNALTWFLNREDPLNSINVFPSGRRSSSQLIECNQKTRITASIKALMVTPSSRTSGIDACLEDGTTPLMLAVKSSATATKTLLDEGADPQKRDNDGRTALMHCLRDAFFTSQQPFSTLEHLLEAGADNRACDSSGLTVLGYWAQSVTSFGGLRLMESRYNRYNKAFRALTATGAFLQQDTLVRELSTLNVPLAIAAKLGNAQLCLALLLGGANPEKLGTHDHCPWHVRHIFTRTDFPLTPLLLALSSKAYATAAVLLQYNADIKYQIPEPRNWSSSNGEVTDWNTTGFTVLHAVVTQDLHFSVKESLIINIENRDQPRNCLFRAAARPDHSLSVDTRHEQLKPPSCELPLESDSEDGESNYHKANGMKSEFEISKDVYSTGTSRTDLLAGDTLLDWTFPDECIQDSSLQAIIYSFHTLVERRKALVEYTLSKGVPVNATTLAGITSLAVCVALNDLDIARILLAHGADPNISKVTGETPLMIAAQNGNHELVRSLLTSGAEPNAQLNISTAGNCQLSSTLDQWEIVDHDLSKSYSWKGYISVGTALTWARGEVRDLLLRHGADPAKEEATRECDCPSVQDMVQKDQLNPNSRYGDEITMSESSEDPGTESA
ncbi:hypothetical protein G7054_g684 [Neopestalotiopsis clavispora]|nr:hypothetical protein G7054_g684 [Neopestalotiopsis clavispora]